MDEEQSCEVEKHNAPLGPQVTLADLQDLDFEGIISDSTNSDCHQLSNSFREASDLHVKLEDETAMPAARAFAMLADIAGLHEQFENSANPFGPMAILEGRRSAIPDDYRGNPIPALAYAAENANHPVLKARLCDVCWLIDRKRHPLRLLAIDAYLQIALGLESGQLQDRSERFYPAIGFTSRDALKRALTIGRSLPAENPQKQQSRDTLSKFKEIALQSGEPVCVLWFCEMDFDFMISMPEQLAGEIEAFLQAYSEEGKLHIIIDLWRLASRTWHRAKNDENKYRCRIQAAELLVTHADRQPTAMQCAHWLSQAISEYHGIPETRDRRAELKHKLIDVQAEIPDEMTSFAHSIDLTDSWEATEKQFESLENLLDGLLMFAQLSASRDPDKLTEKAIQSIRAHPLSSLFGTSIHDHEGKTKFKTPGGSFADGEHGPSVKMQIAQHEDIYRRLLVHGKITPAKELLSDQFIISSETLYKLLVHSPFVPSNLAMTFSIGFERFFASDSTSALYVLTPMLENSLRHLLKIRGHDVTSFDDYTQTQQDLTITGLFDQKRDELIEIFGLAITEDIERVFLDKSGPTIRHEVAHGLLHDGSPYGHDAVYACWLLFRLCCIPLFQDKDAINLGV